MAIFLLMHTHPPLITHRLRTALLRALWVLCALTALTAIPAQAPQKTRFDLEARFTQLDQNNDGAVTREEAGKAPWFDSLDLDHDGRITLEEARRALAALANKGSANTPSNASIPTAPASPNATPPARKGPGILKPGDVGIGRRIDAPAFTDLAGSTNTLSQLMGPKGLVIAFTTTSCPVSKRYLPTIARLAPTLRDSGIALLLINPYTSEKPDVIRSELQAAGLQAPCIHDRDGSLTRSLGARSTTEVLLLDPALTLRYRGAIDDQYGVDYNRDTPAENHLLNAIAALKEGIKPRIEATEAPGCELESTDPATPAAPGPTKVPAIASAPTFHRDIARILQQNCAECHHEGGLAPFALDTPEDVKDRAKAIRRVITAGTMPPWFAAPPAEGQPNPWANDCSLSARDKADLLAWINNSERPLGDPAHAPAPRSWARDAWSIGQPDLILQIPKPFAVKATGFLPYQSATVTTTLAEDRWVQAYEIRPTAREVVHHVIVRVDEKGINPARGGRSSAEGFWAAYVPGNTSHRYPEGFARKLPAGATVHFEIHYTPSGKATEDQLRMGLVFATTPPRYAVQTSSVANQRLSIPPGAAHHVETAERPAPTDLWVGAFLAHMHVRGTAFRYELVDKNDATTLLLDIPRYDFNWQLRYELREPLHIPRGTRLRITAAFDNSPANKANPDPSKTVRWGAQTTDEMMIGYIEHYTAIAPTPDQAHTAPTPTHTAPALSATAPPASPSTAARTP